MKRVTRDFCAKSVSAFLRAGLCPKGYALRLCGAGDLPVLLAIGKECFAYNTPTRGETRHMLIKGHGAVIALEEAKGGMIGYAAVEAHAGRQTLYLNTVAIVPAFRGKGLGPVLYAFTSFLAEQAQARAIWCHVVSDNVRGIHLLEQSGYEIVRVEEDYYDDGKAALVMRRNSKA